MVKKAKTPVKDVGGRPARDSDTLRTERLVLRVHPDFLAVLSERADELRMTRSRYVEEMIRGVLALDPRNPHFDKNGKIDPKAKSEAEARSRNPLNFLAQLANQGGMAAMGGFERARPRYTQEQIDRGDNDDE